MTKGPPGHNRLDPSPELVGEEGAEVRKHRGARVEFRVPSDEELLNISLEQTHSPLEALAVDALAEQRVRATACAAREHAVSHK